MSEPNPLLEAINQLVNVVSKLDAKIDSLSTPSAEPVVSEPEKPKKKRGRPRKAPAQTPTPEPSLEEPELLFEEDDEEDDGGIYRSGEKKMAVATGIPTGKRQNNFRPNAYAVPKEADDTKMAAMIKSGALKLPDRRPAVKEVVIRCSSCNRKYKLPRSAITPASLEDNKWFCNTCAGSR